MLSVLVGYFAGNNYFSLKLKKFNNALYHSSRLLKKEEYKDIERIFALISLLWTPAWENHKLTLNESIDKFYDCRNKTDLYGYEVLDGFEDDSIVESYIFLEQERQLDFRWIDEYIQSQTKLMSIKIFKNQAEIDTYLVKSSGNLAKILARTLSLNHNDSILIEFMISLELLDIIRNISKSFDCYSRIISKDLRNKFNLPLDLKKESTIHSIEFAKSIRFLIDSFVDRHMKAEKYLKNLPPQTKKFFQNISIIYRNQAEKIYKNPKILSNDFKESSFEILLKTLATQMLT